jgi:hypothetical protein
MSRIAQMPLIALTAIRNRWVQHMSTQTTPGQSFPTPCKRCGGALYPPDDTCPWCGASHAVAYGIRLQAAGHALPPDDPDTHAPDATQSAPQHAAHHPHLMLPDRPIAPLSMPVPLWKSLGKWIFTKGLVVVLLLGALLYAGYALFGDHKDSTTDEPATKTATGTIVPYEPASAPSARQSVASIAPSPPTPAPAPAPSPPVAHVPLPVAPAGPAPAQVVLPPLPPRGITKHRDVPEALQAARASLQANDLTGAQAALAEVLVAQPDNADARLMQQDLLQRQTKRDHAMRNANVCAADRLWSCVRHNATDALAIDATNPNVRALLERSIREAGWNTPALPTARGGAQATAPTIATANPPPTRPAKRGNANAQIPVANTPAPAPAPATATATATATAASGTDPNSVDARIRAIVESGWSHPAPRAATPASAAPAAP